MQCVPLSQIPPCCIVCAQTHIFVCSAVARCSFWGTRALYRSYNISAPNQSRDDFSFIVVVWVVEMLIKCSTTLLFAAFYYDRG